MSDTPSVGPEHEVASAGGIAGWYGKLPSLGDFASRRLPEEFLQPWDAWLCERIAQTQAQLGESWLLLYLTCPVWRFFVMPGALTHGLNECWTGVLMASVDRVGRHFPLTICAPLPNAPAREYEMDGIWEWLASIEAVALDALDFDYSIERLDAQLSGLPLPQVTRYGQSAAFLHGPWTISSAAGFAGQFGDQSAALWQSGVRGMSLWSAAGAPRAAQAAQPEPVKQVRETAELTFTVWAARGMPDNELFTTMLRNQQP
ncbi:type VI secretion system-associated protein TagF [Paraburkholderia flagellata]|uniref:type VI secretion system-associated protein TagF n=1 Tax=Paraburkholderia flagellata TaxID=2883241 RepID=UPI001F23C888|nr:type VI secretion system-associated protein TagF [Paraburkholderia flagellata]